MYQAYGNTTMQVGLEPANSVEVEILLLVYVRMNRQIVGEYAPPLLYFLAKTSLMCNIQSNLCVFVLWFDMVYINNFLSGISRLGAKEPVKDSKLLERHISRFSIFSTGFSKKFFGEILLTD
uniref:Uncharacterized protein n=1 Tax=Glossina pallidipes TaxID=7398 RepID=A0A1B0AHM3_GLOPL